VEKGSLLNEPFSFLSNSRIYMSSSEIYSVSEITHTIKMMLEENISTLWIEGEVSNFKSHYSGHYYFTLKDTNAQISAVMWRSRTTQQSFVPEDGMKIQALGNIRLYEKSGRYQVDIIRMQQAGIGHLQLEFEQLKQRLSEEGIFNQEYKKTLPEFPQTIGMVTSPTGAAVQDMMNVLKRRAPYIELIIKPVKVQGQNAAEEIAAAIESVNRYNAVDLLIIGRGGGSLEDLWAFNEEIVARAVFDSKIPVISAVGHEIDFTISDFVADLRAPTPSAAAELAAPDAEELRGRIAYFSQRLTTLLGNRIQMNKNKIEGIAVSYGLRRLDDQLKQYALQIDDLNVNLVQAISSKYNRNREQIHFYKQRLDSVNPRQVLERGYSITYHQDKVIKELEDLKSGDELITEIARGKISSTFRTIEKEQKDA